MKRFLRGVALCVLVVALARPAWRVGILDGFVTVWKNGEACYKSAVPAARLPQADRAALQQGLSVDSRAEMSRMQEDFLS